MLAHKYGPGAAGFVGQGQKLGGSGGSASLWSTAAAARVPPMPAWLLGADHGLFALSAAALVYVWVFEVGVGTIFSAK